MQSTGPAAARAVATVARAIPVRGRERLARRLFARYRDPDSMWTVRLGAGLVVGLPAGSHQTWVVAFTGAYHASQVELVARHLRPGTVALDIGASLGLYAVQLAAHARRTGSRVVAVEPIPANAGIIRANLDRNGLAGVASIIETALGPEDGSIPLRIEKGGAGNATVAEGVPAAEMAEHTVQGGLGPEELVPVRRLDTLSFDAPVSVVKIDVEGFEMGVLAGAGRFIAEHRPVIFGEFSEAWMRSRGVEPDAPFEWAAGHGYSVFGVAVDDTRRVLRRTDLKVTPAQSSRDRGGTELLLIPSTDSNRPATTPTSSSEA